MQPKNRTREAPRRFHLKYKTLLFLVTTLVVLLVLLSNLVFHYLSRDDYKSVRTLIENNINKQGYTLRYQQISIKPSFVPSISLDHAVFENTHGNPDTLLEAEKLDISFKLLPLLLRKDFIIDSFTLNDAGIYIVRDEAGHNNWLHEGQLGGKKANTTISLGKSYFRNVDIYYTGPTFVDKKITFDEAIVSYTSAGALGIEAAEGHIDQDAFKFNGHIDKLDAFLKGQGANIVLDFELEQLLRLSLEGKIGSTSLPTGKGVKTKVSGKNISTWLKDFVPEITDTDYFALRGDIFSNGESLGIRVKDSEFRRNGNVLNLRGRVENVGVKSAVLDLSGGVKGEQLDALSEWKFLDQSLQMYIPQTDSYAFEFNIQGPLEKLFLGLKKATVSKAGHTFSASGFVKNLNDMSGYDLHVQVIGNNLGELEGQFFPEMQAGYSVPKTDEYSISADFSGNKTDWKVSQLSAQLLTEKNQLAVYSQPERDSHLDEIHVFIESSGSDLLELAGWVGYTQLPGNIEHDMRFNLDGSLDALSLSELNARLSYETSEVNLEGEVFNVNSLEGMKLVFDIAGKESELALLLGLKDFQDKHVQANGLFLGTLDSFSLDKFSYIGGRGKSSGDLSMDLTGKPVLKASLGDTQIIFETNNAEAAGESSDDEVFDLSWMDSLDVDIEYASLLIKASNADFEVLGSKIVMESGKLNWSPLQLNYKGKVLDTSLSINAVTDELGFSARTHQIDLGALLKELKWFERFKGLADFDMQLTSSGKNNKELVKNLHGKGKIIIKQATVKDFGSTNMSYIRTLMPWRKDVSDLEISCLLSTVKIEQGVMRFEHFFMDNKNMYLTGGGKVDLNNSSIDMALSPRAKNRNFFDANVSLFINGTVDKPRVRVGKLSTVSDVGIKYGQWALLGPFALALPKLKFTQAPSCDQALGSL